MKVFECEKCGSDSLGIWDDKAAPRCPIHGPMREVITVPVGSKWWAAIMADRGEKVSCGDKALCAWTYDRGNLASIAISGYETGWYILPPAPPPWVPKRGELVKGWYGGSPVYGYYSRHANDYDLVHHFDDLSDDGALVYKVEPFPAPAKEEP